MKRFFLYVLCMVSIMTIPVVVWSQNYDKMWKEVDVLKKKDLPRSVIDKTGEIYSLALKSGDKSQMIKALIVGAEYKTSLSHDSLSSQICNLKKMAKLEKDISARAVLNSIIATMYKNNDADSALHYYHLSLADKCKLAGISAQKFHPVVVSEEISRTYFNDNMYDFLSRQAINGLLSFYSYHDSELMAKEIISIYDSLISLYSEGEYAARSSAAFAEEAKLIYLNEYCRSIRYKISDDEFINKMEGLCSEFKDLDVYCDITLKLADKYRGKGRLTDAVDIIDGALQLYPENRWTKELKGMKNLIMSPYLDITFPFVYPEYETDMYVKYKNISGFKLEMFRLDLTPSSVSLHREKTDYNDIIRKHGSRISVNSYSLSPTSDYKIAKTNLKYRFAQAGIYMMKITPRVKYAKSEYRIVHVSPYQAVAISLPHNKKEFVAVDSRTGNPVPGAEIVCYKEEYNEYRVSKVYKTDNKGSVILDADENLKLINVRTASNDFMPIEYFYNNRVYSSSVNKITTHTSLFTDRSIYRPGQKISLSGVRYKMYEDSVSVEKNAQVLLVMRNSDWKEISSKEVSTDDFGVYSTEFIIPENAFPGYYSIIADNVQASVKVEEYKRPTFDVEFDELKQTFTFNDSVRVSAVAETFAGASLGMARVKYRIMRSECRWWRVPLREEEISSGETIASADGRFYIDFSLLKPDSYSTVNPLTFYRYKVIAAVTSQSGETQEGIIELSVGEKSMGLHIDGLASKVAKEKKGEITFVASNLNSIPVGVEVGYLVYGVDSSGEKQQPVLCSGKHMSNKPFVPEDIYSLPSGSYRIEIKANDDKGRECTSSHDFILFSVNDKHVPANNVYWFWHDRTGFSDNKPEDIYIGTSKKGIYLMVDVFAANSRISSERIVLNDTVRKFSYKYLKEYGDGISVSFNFVYRGKLYSKEVVLSRPKPEKKLKIHWETFRDKLIPGQKEEWKLSVKDKSGNPVKANVLASAYDASLDDLYSDKWHFKLDFPRKFFRPQVKSIAYKMLDLGVYFHYEYFGTGINHIYGRDFTHLMPVSLDLHSKRLLMKAGDTLSRSYGSKQNNAMKKALEVKYVPMAKEDDFVEVKSSRDIEECLTIVEDVEEASYESTGHINLRANFCETGFYYPMLRTDSMGIATISFVMPDALTKWNFNGFAHTRNMDYGLISANFITSKPFMVQPNVPRFVRVGDKSSVSSMLVNMSGEDISGKVTMIIENPVDGKKILTHTKSFSVKEGENGAVTFNFEVKGDYDILSCTIVADAGDFSDGERHYLPVLSDRQVVVENTSLQLCENEGKDVEVKSMFNHGSSTATNKKIRIEMTSNPQWHVISSLPVMSIPQNDDAISWATSFYVNSLSRHIVNTNPEIKRVFDTWMLYGKKEDDFLSELKHNETLKNIVMAETPWLVEAENEEMRKRQVSFLFDENGISSRLSSSVVNLRKLQLADGSWSWFGGMNGSRYITVRVALMFARLKSMGVSLSSEAIEMYNKSLAYLRSEVVKEYHRMKKDINRYSPDDIVVKYLYICSVDNHAMKMADSKVNKYMIEHLKNMSSQLDIYGKSVMAIIMDAAGQKTEAGTFIRSVMEYMVSDKEMGAYFDTRKAGYSYNSYRIPAQVAAMEAIMRISDENDSLLDDMRLWLLKQKQVQQWDTPLETVDAIYAFLVSGGGKIDGNSVMTANIGSEGFSTPDDAIGFAGCDFTDSELKSELKGEKKISFTRRGEGIGWVSVYTSYMEDIKKIRPYKGNGLKIVRKYMSGGKELSHGTKLEKGDKIRVFITISADRDMDFVRIKDSRAACMEPVEQLSGYGHSCGIYYYKANKDATTEFFIDNLRKGEYTLYYDVYVTRTGKYVSGTSEILSVYAPQFMAHSEGDEIEVE